jgi:hypothetical protein
MTLISTIADARIAAAGRRTRSRAVALSSFVLRPAVGAALSFAIRLPSSTIVVSA